eukprot:GHRQ01021625.1.p1 GENE.GHRQ01021625.1~~GHRQ01021625.1.p1  ORF type:complete len:104 (+),score=19.58 GHRQ01021625.1:261-572(+)
MAMGMPYGLQAMLKDGHKHFSGVEEAVMKNIEACKALAQMTKTSLGPNGAYGRSWAVLYHQKAGRTRHGSTAVVPVATAPSTTCHTFWQQLHKQRCSLTRMRF